MSPLAKTYEHCNETYKNTGGNVWGRLIFLGSFCPLSLEHNNRALKLIKKVWGRFPPLGSFCPLSLKHMNTAAKLTKWLGSFCPLPLSYNINERHNGPRGTKTTPSSRRSHHVWRSLGGHRGPWCTGVSECGSAFAFVTIFSRATAPFQCHVLLQMHSTKKHKRHEEKMTSHTCGN